MVCSAFQHCCQPGRCPEDGLTCLWELTVKHVTDSGSVTDQGWFGIDTSAKPTRAVLRRLLFSSLLTSAKSLANCERGVCQWEEHASQHLRIGVKTFKMVFPQTVHHQMPLHTHPWLYISGD